MELHFYRRVLSSIILTLFRVWGTKFTKKEPPTESIVKLFSDSLKLKISSSDLILSHSLNWSRRTLLTESIVNFFSDPLKMKKWMSDLVFLTLVKMVLNIRLVSASLPLFQNE
jgi:hypothetical protein